MRFSFLSIALAVVLSSFILTAASAQEITDARKKKEVVKRARGLFIDKGSVGNFTCTIRSQWFHRAWDSLWGLAQLPESLAVPPCMDITMRATDRSDANLQHSESPDLPDEALGKSLYDRYRVLRQVIEIADISWRSPEEVFLPGTASYQVIGRSNGYEIHFRQGGDTATTLLDADFMVRSMEARLKEGNRMRVTPSLSRHGAHARVDSMRIELTRDGTSRAVMTMAFTYGSVASRYEAVSSVRVTADHVMRIMQRNDPDVPIDDVITYDDYTPVKK